VIPYEFEDDFFSISVKNVMFIFIGITFNL
jgi:hypothetical protein